MTIDKELDEIKKRRKTRLSNFELWWQEKGIRKELDALGFPEAHATRVKEYMRRAYNKGAESGIDWVAEGALDVSKDCKSGRWK